MASASAIEGANSGTATSSVSFMCVDPFDGRNQSQSAGRYLDSESNPVHPLKVKEQGRENRPTAGCQDLFD